MKLHIINSNSLGNGYILTDDNNESLIIELGCQWSKYKEALNYKIDNIVGVLISHSHG